MKRTVVFLLGLVAFVLASAEKPTGDSPPISDEGLSTEANEPDDNEGKHFGQYPYPGGFGGGYPGGYPSGGYPGGYPGGFGGGYPGGFGGGYPGGFGGGYPGAYPGGYPGGFGGGYPGGFGGGYPPYRPPYGGYPYGGYPPRYPGYNPYWDRKNQGQDPAQMPPGDAQPEAS